ncbi:MAG: sulfotransferase [Sphingobium sp.]|nr:sulfotransferase [Sphingobium sp.]MBP6111340.1 sulfotransferase [Sphingobium sp.]MBP8671322.1 sulfotransferase [Sphingobium sp.]MBP9156658.1 sulfotransferase [Sphingobium sp.]MCC6483161.1 sulfotransferase [Sphingomonadaceae bacterium]
MASQSALDPATAEIVRHAVSAAQSGDLARARTIAARGLAEGRDGTALHAFLGMIEARAGDLAAAAVHLRQAHAARPGDVTIACNLTAVLVDAGDMAGALDTATMPLALTDPSLRIARYRGFAAQALGQYAEAEGAYAHVVACAPDDFESWNNLGNARLALGDPAGGIAALRRAMALDPAASPTRINLATALRAGGGPAEAEQVLRAAAADFPEDAHPLHELYVLLKQDGRHEDALPVIAQATERDPHNAGLLLKLGIEYGLVRDTARAEDAYRRAIAADPALSDAYLGLVIQYEHSNREEEFAPLIGIAEANGVNEGVLRFMRALELRRAKRFEEALVSLAAVPAEVEPERTAHIRATLLDRMGRTDEAFASFTEANRLHQAHETEPLRRAAGLRDQLEGEIRLMTPGWVAGWRMAAAPPPERPDPVFLVGFPRSGTTLLDTILMGHPDTVVMEEQPPLNLVDSALGGLENVAALDEDGVRAARRRYFEEVEKLHPLPDGAMLIDKSPLFLHKVPLIARLFPAARYILALRHPCDVVLSCYMSNFRLNSAMANFLRLEDAAAFYDLSFRYWEHARAHFPAEARTIVYERLVEDVSAEVRPLFDWLGLAWHDEALDHQRTARNRGLITTASYAQVTEPIYKRASGRWRRYRAHLEPVLPVLRPWAERFGYSLDD